MDLRIAACILLAGLVMVWSQAPRTYDPPTAPDDISPPSPYSCDDYEQIYPIETWKTIRYGAEEKVAGAAHLTQEGPGAPVRVTLDLNPGVSLRGSEAVKTDVRIVEGGGSECPDCDPTGRCDTSWDSPYKHCPNRAPPPGRFGCVTAQLLGPCPPEGSGSFFYFKYADGTEVMGNNIDPSSPYYTGQSNEANIPSNSGLTTHVSCSDDFNMDHQSSSPRFGFSEKSSGAPNCPNPPSCDQAVDEPIVAFAIQKCSDGRRRGSCGSCPPEASDGEDSTMAAGCPVSSGRYKSWVFTFSDGTIITGNNAAGSDGVYNGNPGTNQGALPGFTDPFHVSCSDNYHLDLDPTSPYFGLGENGSPRSGEPTVSSFSIAKCRGHQRKGGCSGGAPSGPDHEFTIEIPPSFCDHCIWIYIHLDLIIEQPCGCGGYGSRISERCGGSHGGTCISHETAWVHEKGEKCWCGGSGSSKRCITPRGRSKGGCIHWGTYCCDGPEPSPSTVPSPPVCGNGIVEPPEECDDGNLDDDNDCTCTSMCTVPICGDGIISTGCGEECDPLAPPVNVLCNDVTCLLGVCGDGYIDVNEECDPPESQGGEVGCSDTCQLPPDPNDPVCGNGVKEDGEECDDGETGSTMCYGTICTRPPPLTCGPPCTRPVCGNGVLEPQIGEDCDDGNDNDFDGCKNDCTIDPDPGSVEGDPHFKAFYGGEYDVMGEPGRVFNIFSAADMQVNARFVQFPEDPEATYIGEVGMRIGKHKVYLDTSGQAVFDPWVEPDGRGVFHLQNEATVFFTSQRLEAHVGEWIFIVSRMMVLDTENLHLDVALNSKTGQTPMNVNVHGLLGVTARRPVRAKPLGHQGEGVIEGTFHDYALGSDDIFGTDFKFNKFREE